MFLAPTTFTPPSPPSLLVPLNPLSSSKQSGSRSSTASQSAHPPPSRKRIPYLPLATSSNGDVDEAAGVQLTLVGAALRRLGLLLGLDLSKRG